MSQLHAVLEIATEKPRRLQKGTCFDMMDAFVFSAIQRQRSANMAISILKMLCGTNIHFNVHMYCIFILYIYSFIYTAF